MCLPQSYMMHRMFPSPRLRNKCVRSIQVSLRRHCYCPIAGECFFHQRTGRKLFVCERNIYIHPAAAMGKAGCEDAAAHPLDRQHINTHPDIRMRYAFKSFRGIRSSVHYLLPVQRVKGNIHASV